MKILHVVLKVLFSLILIMPVMGVLGVFPAPTADLYNTAEAFAFIQALGATSYMMWLIAIVNILTILALWTKREALGAALAVPLTVNVVAFHLILDGGLLTGGAIMANLMLALNLYLIWKNYNHYKPLLQKGS